jgi:hypothetical protein
MLDHSMLSDTAQSTAEISHPETSDSGSIQEDHPGQHPGRMRYTRYVSFSRASRVTVDSEVESGTEAGAGTEALIVMEIILHPLADS